MTRRSLGIGLALFVAVFVPALPLAAQDEPGCKDHPLFTRIIDFYIDSCEVADFDSHEFMDRNENEIVFEGQKTRIGYCLKEGGRQRAFLEIWKNYANALAKLGGTIEFNNRYSANLHLLTRDREVWVLLNDSGGDCFTLVIVEKKAMVQEVTANEMLDALNREGFIALSITFDVDKATIRQESQAIVEEIAAMLKGSPTLNVSVEGHTDSTGVPERNKALSQQRADAVVSALVKLGISSSRLSAVGWGQEKPVADNRTEEGRAKNRRVEIVKK